MGPSDALVTTRPDFTHLLKQPSHQCEQKVCPCAESLTGGPLLLWTQPTPLPPHPSMRWAPEVMELPWGSHCAPAEPAHRQQAEGT